MLYVFYSVLGISFGSSTFFSVLTQCFVDMGSKIECHCCHGLFYSSGSTKFNIVTAQIVLGSLLVHFLQHFPFQAVSKVFKALVASSFVLVLHVVNFDWSFFFFSTTSRIWSTNYMNLLYWVSLFFFCGRFCVTFSDIFVIGLDNCIIWFS